MKRSHILLSSVAAILVVALFWVFAYQPQREAYAEVQDRIAAEADLQQQLQSEIDRLRAVRMEAPEIEAQLAAANSIVPRDAALPSSLRQMQLAADESGVVLNTMTTSRPTQVEGGAEGLSSIAVNVTLLGGYFQVIDFLRRVEDPTITARGVVWDSAALSIDEYPVLNVTLSGEIFAALEVAPPPEAEGASDGEADGEVEGEDGTDDVIDDAPADDAGPDDVAVEANS